MFYVYTISVGLTELTEAYLEPCQTSKMGRSAKKVNNFEPLKISAKHSILDVLNTPLSSSQSTHDVVSTSIRTRATSYDILSKLKRRCVYGDTLSLPAISSYVLEYSKSSLKENC